MTRTSWLAFLLLIACADSTEPATAPEADSSSGHEAAVCEPGADQTCNDDPSISSLHGSCQPDGTCRCMPGVEKNPTTGRCL